MRSMISEEVRWIPYSVFNSFIAAATVMFTTSKAVGSLASYAYARLRFLAGGAPSAHPAEPPDPHLGSSGDTYYAIVQSPGS